MIILLYKPPKGKWYVHSHKIYSSVAEARVAAKEFLAPGTPINFCGVESDLLDQDAEKVW